jgi:glutaredoxin
VEAQLARFQAAHTQVLGVSVDSVYSHANWARDLGGISFPLLSDFEPKGAVGKAYGVYLSDRGITDRATVIIDGCGIVRYAVSVTPGGEREIATLAAVCEEIDQRFPIRGGEQATASGLPADTVLYVKSNCGFSRAVLLARDNLHLQDRIEVRNVTEDSEAAKRLARTAGQDKAPCLVVGGNPMHESMEIIKYLVDRAAPPL